MTHAYDDPDLSAVQFLLAVMRDQSVPLYLRMKAAHVVAPYEHHAPAPVQVIPNLDLMSEVQGHA